MKKAGSSEKRSTKTTGGRKTSAAGKSGKRSFSDRKPKENDFGNTDKRPYKKRDSEDSYEKRPYKKRDGDSSYSDRKPYQKRDSEGGYEKRPYKKREGDSGYSDRKPYQKRDSEGGYEKRPYKKRDGDSGYSDRKPYQRRDSEGDYEKRPYKKRDGDSGYSDRKPYQRRDSEDSYEKRPYKKRDGDSNYSDRKPYQRRDSEGGYEKRPYKKRDGDSSYSDRKPYQRRDSEGGYEKRPYKKREGDSSYSDRKPYQKRYRDDNFESHGYNKSQEEYGDSGKNRRPRLTKEKNYIGRKYEPRKVDIYIKDNSDRTSHTYTQNIKKEGVRLNKFIATAGICSRREADDLIEAGVISINGQIVTQLGSKVMPNDVVKYGDQLLLGEKLRYVLLNKPKGYITTTDDPQERKTVMMLIQNACDERVYPVGRLDKNTTGLLLFTNDGEIAKKLTHPKHQIEKLYQVELDKPLAKTDMQAIMDGMELDDGIIKVDAIEYGESKKDVGVAIHSGKNRIVRRIFESLGYDVVKLDRVVFAGLTKKDLPRGKFRLLSSEEVNILRRIK